MISRSLQAFVLLVLSSIGDESDWPRWRGPEGDGVSRESEWSSFGAEEPIWTRNVGRGYSSSSIVDGLLFTLGHREGQGVDEVACLDARTGETRWTYGFPMIVGAGHEGGTLTTPTVDGDRVHVSSRDGVVRSFARGTGELLWSVDLKQRHGVRPARYGFGASPFVLEGGVIVCADRVLRLDRADGRTTWKSAPVGALYSTPSLLRQGERSWLAVFAKPGLVLFDSRNLSIAGRYPWARTRNHVNAATPVIVGERVFISSGYEQGCALLEWRGKKLAPVFESRVMRTKMAGCVLWGAHLYGFDESLLKCIDLEGRERWRVRGLGNGSLLIADGRLIVLTSSGELIVAPASPEGFEEESKRKVLDGGVYWSTPVLWRGRIYCRNSLGDLVCLDHRPGVGTDAVASSEPAVRGAAALPSAESLFRRHLEAVGGEAVLRSRRSVTMAGTYVRDSVASDPGPWRVDRMAPNLWRWEARLEADDPRQLVRCFDGEIAWEINPFFGSKLIVGDALAEVRESAPFYGEADFAEGFTGMETIGLESFAGVPCHRVDATTTPERVVRFYFEVASGRLKGRASSHGTIEIYDAYRSYEGRLLPSTIKRFAADTGGEETYHVESVEFDGVTPERFARDERVEELLRAENQR